MRWLRLAALALLAAWMAAGGALAGAGGEPAPGGRRVALVIGNSTYANAPALVNPRNDARALADGFRRLGFATVGLDLDLGRQAMLRALQAFTREARNAEMALVYYAGHGIEVGGRNYLIPTDAKLATDDDIEFEAIPLDLVLRSVEGAKRLRVAILDACRDNPFAATMVVAGAGRSIGRGLARVEPPGDMLVAYAAREGQVAEDGLGRNSPFAAALARHLETPGLEIQFLFRKVRDDVLEATGNKQQPHVYGSLGGEPFYFVPPPPPVPVAAPPPTPAAPDYAKEIELAFWRSAAASGDPRDLEEYLRQFPAGAFAGLARNRLETVRAQQRVAALPPPADATPPPAPTAREEAPPAAPPAAPPVAAPVPKPAPDDPPREQQVAAILRELPCSLVAASLAGDAVRISGHALRGERLDAAVGRLRALGGVARVELSVEALEPYQCGPVEVLARRAAPSDGGGRSRGLALRPARATVTEGEPVAVAIERPVGAGEIRLDLYTRDGKVRHLRAGPAGLRWPAAGGAGSQLLTAVAAPGALGLDGRPEVEDAAGYLAALDRALARAGGGAQAISTDLALLSIRVKKEAPKSVVERAPATAPAAGKEAASASEPRCKSLLLRLQLGEPLTNADLATLRRECRS